MNTCVYDHRRVSSNDVVVLAHWARHVGRTSIAMRIRNTTYTPENFSMTAAASLDHDVYIAETHSG